ncbi:HYR domain-containing protein [Flavobacterium johnsoniae]|uniref:Conserved repeat domain protein n=6 Tax=Flavobacterium TaxID=237 RepID=A5FJE8_FLAJ1|nr:HYR domain-containing protein [Flavobacterium johnsoniae]ABQ04677.1 conserved repeat domain protein [Flavobacterium johnsoniae UW101]WQG83526.1 HYR domain-containing protein [Flavobacterium johnsoniae UW101]SHK30256.1 gliding motility-associated C-terminal domain-containing protein [Flavobacterium johnsoniae]
MRNSTFNWFKFFKSNCIILFFLLISTSASAQFYTTHYIAPAPWQYFSKANEIVIATNSTTTVKITVSKSDGTLVTNLTAVKGTPAVYRFAGLPKDAPAFTLNTVLNAAGLIVKGDKPISINLRNIASDALGADGSDKDIKGNAALTSFGDAGIGIRFRVGYYRDGSLGNFNNYGDQRPIYSVMAINNGTSIKINNVVTTTLNAGQSYLFTAPIGTLVESSNPVVMNTSAAIDTPGGCGDGAYNQIPPEAVLGTEYFLERGTGNNTAEQTTVVATKDDTKVTIESYSTTGALVGSPVTVTLEKAGYFYTFINGVKDVSFTASHIKADKRVAVYSGTAQKCEVDISTIAPVSECGGSNFIETAKFRNYGTGTLDYFGYILLRSGTEVVTVNGNNIANISGVGARYQIGNTGWYLINFNSQQIGSPDFLSIESNAKLTVSIVQQDGGFSMAGFFSNFAVQPEDPTFTYISGGGCTNNTATLKTPTGFAPYQWYLNGVAISGANSDTYTATKTGAYSVASTLTCGAQTQSKPVSVTLCTDLGVTKTVDNATPCVGSNVEFTVKLSNLGVNNATGVSINDLLPTGYTFVSSTQTIGNYNASTGVWSIGDVNGGITETLKITAKVNASGVYNNTAALPASTVDSNTANNSASVSTTPNPLPTASITGALTACLTTTLNAVTNAASPTYVWYKNNVVISGQTSSSLAVNSDGDYKVKVTNSSTGCEATSAASTVKVSDTEKPAKPVLADITGQCSATATAPITTDNCKGTVTGTTTDPLTYSVQGTYTINWSFNDGNGNVETATQKVIIKDTQKPTITCPSAVVVSANANSCVATGVSLGTPTTSDNCSGTVTVTNNAPSSFPLGNTTVTWTATDAAGNTQTCTQTVTVNDTQKPTITCPSNVVVSANANSCVATGVNLGTPTTSDNCSGAVTVTNNAPSSFPLGNTTVTWTATDAAGNTQTCTQTVTVNDTQKPTITCPSNVIVSANANSCVATGVNLGTPTTSDNCSGAVTVTNNAPSSFPLGNTTVTWTATDAAGNTQTCTQTVKVVGPIVPNKDTASINGYEGGTAVSNVLSNDLLNCNAVVRNEVELTLASTLPSVLTFDTTSGEVTVKPNTPTGKYSFDYKICEVANTSNCNTATVEITVTAPAILAVKEDLGPINGTIGGTTTSLIGLDKLNGVQAVIGSNPGQVTLTATAPTGFTINADGTITVSAGVKKGNYDIEYTICDNNNPATNCSTATSTVVITAADLVANLDAVGSVTGSNTSQTLINVFDNDTKNGSKLDPSDVKLTPGTDPKGFLTIDANGNAVLGANAPAGNYELTYEICELFNPSNCSTNKVQVTVTAPVILAVKEDLGPINGTIGGTTTSLIGLDKLNGVQAVIGSNPGQVTLTAAAPTGFTINADGTITVSAGVKKGNYDIEYTICDNNNPATNCSTATSTVVVTAADLVANLDSMGSVTGGNTSQTLINVFDNDTKNGSKLDPSDVKLTPGTDPKGFLTIDANGNAVLGANAPAGNYEITYEICELFNPSNCSTNKVQVTVTAPVILAVKEDLGPINGTIGGTTTSLIGLDKLNGVQAVIGSNPGQVTLTATAPTGFTINADGTITVSAGVKKGNYDIEYTICDNNNPATNCSTATSTVVVTAADLVANLDAVGSVTGSNTSQTLINVFDNDTKNGLKLDPSDVKLTPGTDPKGFLTIDANGNAVLGANAQAGNYELTYEICELFNPSNCSTNKVQVTVTAPVIDAVAENIGSVNGSTGGTTTVSVIINDKLNGSQAVIGSNHGEVILSKVNLPTGFVLEPDGRVTVPAKTPIGIYEIEYSICEVTNTGNCDTAKSTVEVTGGVLAANPDTILSVVGINQPQTIVNVFDNDTNNTLPLVPSDVKLSVEVADPKGFLTLNPYGTVTLGANAPRGTYELTYQICEVLNQSNCSSGKVEVTVEEPTITVTAESFCSNNVPYVTYKVVADNFTPTNLVTIKWIDSANNVVATQIEQPLSGTILWPGAVIDGNGNGVDWPGWLLANGQWTEGADGFENTRTGVIMQFSLNPTAAIPVSYPAATPQCNARPTFVIIANDDTAGPVDTSKGTNTGTNIFDNDKLNGLTVNPADVILSTTVPNANLTLNANGSVSVKAGTPSGTYQLTYQICDASNSNNCSQAVVKVVVLNSVSPVNPVQQLVLTDDALVAVDGINGSLEFVNVLDNDLLNGQPINPVDVIIKNQSGNSNFEFNADGTVNVKPNTPGGTYAIVYQVCEKANDTNCSTATLNVFVEVPAIALVKTAAFNDENNNTIANAGETISYRFTVTNTGNVPLSGITITDLLPGVVVSGQALDLNVGESNDTNFSALYKITQTDINSGKVSNQASVQGKSARGVVVEDNSDYENIDGDKPTVLDLNGCKIKVLNAFSPNGDQKNERFYIQGLECYPENTVEIYNRWGVLVFDVDHYNNVDRVFKGYSFGRTTMKQSEGLPVGTYFYILKYKDSDSNPHETSGYLYINK